jgi:hypothetical protein
MSKTVRNEQHYSRQTFEMFRHEVMVWCDVPLLLHVKQGPYFWNRLLIQCDMSITKETRGNFMQDGSLYDKKSLSLTAHQHTQHQ